MAGLHYTVPVVPLPEDLVSTTVSEDDHSDWSSGSTYSITDRVIHDHRVWESAEDSNQGHEPGDDGETYWLDAGPVNRWAAFTLDYASPTKKQDGFEYRFSMRESINAVHFAGFTSINTVRARLYDSSSNEVYDSGKLSASPALQDTTQWQWFFGSRLRRDSVNIKDVPDNHPNGELRITVDGGDNCAINWIGWGMRTEIGVGVRYGMRVSMEDYSKITTDKWGTAKIKRRRASRRMNPTVIIEREKSDDVRRRMFELRATPIFWEASTQFESTQLLGFYKPPLDLVYSNYSYHELSLDIEGFAEG